MAYAARFREGNLPRYRKKSTVEEGVHTRVELQLERPSQKLTGMVGRTNTEYASCAPVFGRNMNLEKCPHSQPDVQYEIFESTLLATADNFNEFVFYVRRCVLVFS